MKPEKDISPLERIPKENHFKTPDGYFDDFSMKMQMMDKSATTTRWSPIRIAIPAIATVAILIAGVFFFNQNETELEALTDEDIEWYLAENDSYYSEDWSSETLTDLYADTEESFTEEEEEIIEYLLDNDIAMSRIIDEI